MTEQNNIKLCECGCGQPTRIYRGIPRRYINFHYSKLLIGKISFIVYELKCFGVLVK